MDFLDTIITSLIYLALCFVLFVIGKLAFRLFHRDVNVREELVEHDNLAFAIAHVGYFIGILLAIGSAIVGPSHGLVQDIIDISIYGLLAILLLNLSLIINDKVILRRFSIREEISGKQNVAVGIAEAGIAVATGLILMGSVSGEGGSILTALAFWAIGQVLLIVIALFYNVINRFDLHDQLASANVAIGIAFGGALIAMANLIRYGLSGEFETWQETLTAVGIEIAAGLVFLPVVRLVADKMLLPGQNLTDELVNQEKPNIGAAFVEAFAYVGGSVLITWSI
ncbi:DUF350 domain-containing protein [Nafulsella turpanensis]|uniref:DUF350 domain-containing protein n=1 Tax=Nafulsella turpanensis TaxID=1265690 RepID=UPI000348F4A2|nr:DUF350 domain-containing protein [Nafulsella turpanensis]